VANSFAIGASDGTQSLGVGGISSSSNATLNMTTGAANGLYDLLPTNGQTWTANAAVVGSSGTVTLTSFSSTGASGTFSFVAVALAGTGSTGTKTITNGSFSVTF
jgi:hypothetical protein